MDAPETRYTKSGDVRIAYEVFATDDVITTMDAAGSSKASVLGVGEASPGDVLVSITVRDLVAGSGISFADRGELSVNGVPERWHLFSVVDV